MQLRTRRALLGYLAALPALASAQATSKNALVAMAEQFIADNGYTSRPPAQVKDKLDSESFNFGLSREEELAFRFNTLVPKAIGIKIGQRSKSWGWSVAFDYASAGDHSAICRVVTMNEDGTSMVMQHVDGKRQYFVGFE
jgi:hypothetical protein